MKANNQADDAVKVAPQQAKKAAAEQDLKSFPTKPMPKEIGGPKGLEPTRYGDWEAKGRCYDF